MEDFESKYGNQYDDLKVYPERPVTVSVLLGVIGAVIGALPGLALWIIIGKLGFVSAYCGALMALGSAFGYNLMTKKSELPAVIGIVVCIAVMAVAVYLAERIVWSWEIADIFKDTVYPDFVEYMQDYDCSASEIERLYSESLNEEFGFSEVTFANCFSKLNGLLEYCDAKSDFYISLFKSGVFALLGGAVGLARLGK